MRRYLLLLACASLAIDTAGAQTAVSVSPSAVRERTNETLDYYQLQDDLAATESAASGGPTTTVAPVEEPAKPPPTTAVRFRVERIVTDPSAVLTAEEIQGITRELEGRTVGIEDLQAAVQRLNDLYRGKGYPTARAVLPPQRVEEGTVRIQLIEARIGEVRLEGLEHTRTGFVTRRVDVAPGELVELGQLESELVRFNRTYDVELRASLVPGTSFGTTDYVLRAREPPNVDTRVYVDNAGRDEIGRERGGALFSDYSLLGYRDRLDLGAQYAEDTLAGYVSYGLPINRAGTSLTLTYDYSEIEIGSGPLAAFDVEGDSYAASAVASHPVLRRNRVSVDGYAGIDRKHSTTRFADVGSVSTELALARTGVELRAADTGGVWYLHPVVTGGFESLGGDRSFTRVDLSIHRLQHLGPNLTALLRLSGQWSDTDLLPASEQVQLGGVATVRGFDEGELLGDNGYFVSAELQWSVLPGRLTTSLFVDHGGAFSVASPDEWSDHLTSGGLGLLIDLSRWFTARLSYGVPLGDRPGIDDEPTLHFYLQSRLL